MVANGWNILSKSAILLYPLSCWRSWSDQKLMPAHNREATKLDHSILAYLRQMISAVDITISSNIPWQKGANGWNILSKNANLLYPLSCWWSWSDQKIMPAHNREATKLDHSILAYLRQMISAVDITISSNIKRAPMVEIFYQRAPSCFTLYLVDGHDPTKR